LVVASNQQRPRLDSGAGKLWGRVSVETIGTTGELAQPWGRSGANRADTATGVSTNMDPTKIPPTTGEFKKRGHTTKISLKIRTETPNQAGRHTAGKQRKKQQKGKKRKRRARKKGKKKNGNPQGRMFLLGDTKKKGGRGRWESRKRRKLTGEHFNLLAPAFGGGPKRP